MARTPRQVISSGDDFLESFTLLSKPIFNRKFCLGFKTRKLNHFLSHLAIKSEDAAKESPVLVSEDIQGLAHARPCMSSGPDSTLIT